MNRETILRRFRSACILGGLVVVGVVGEASASITEGSIEGTAISLAAWAPPLVLVEVPVVLAKGEAVEQYHPVEHEVPESIKAKTDALDAAKNARRRPVGPPIEPSEPSTEASQDRAPVSHPQLSPEERIDEQGHDTVLP